MGKPFSTTKVAGCNNFSTRTALPFLVQPGSLSRLVASPFLSRISVPILQPHRLHLPLRRQDETHLVQNKWRHSRFELSRCGDAPHWQHSSSFKVFSSSLSSSSFPSLAFVWDAPVIFVAWNSNGSQKNELAATFTIGYATKSISSKVLTIIGISYAHSPRT